MSYNSDIDNLTEEEKEEMIKYCDNAIKTRPLTQIAVELKVPFLKLRALINRRNTREKLRAKGNDKLKEKKFADFKDLEITLLDWTRKMLDANVKLTRRLIMKKAAFMKYKTRGLRDPSCLLDWVKYFISRHNILEMIASKNKENDKKFKPQRNTREEADALSIWKITGLLRTYLPKDIFIVDEFSLLYDLMPNELSSYNKKNVRNRRLSVIIGTNSEGTEKMKLLVIGEPDQPPPQNLFVDYVTNSKAYVTRDIFIQWLQTLERYLEYKKRNIVLLLDVCPVHPEEMILSNIKLCFVSKTNQPFKKGIIHKVKEEYRLKLLQLSQNSNTPDYPIDVPMALKYLSDAWNSVEPELIKSCFRKAGLTEKIDLEDIEDAIIPQIPDYPGYLTVDDNEPICDAVFVMNTVIDDKPEVVTEGEALVAAQKLRTFLSTKKMRREALDALRTIEDRILSAVDKAK